jgi:hypothetical protein
MARKVRVMSYRSGNVKRASARPPIAAEVAASQRASGVCQVLTHALQQGPIYSITSSARRAVLAKR